MAAVVQRALEELHPEHGEDDHDESGEGHGVEHTRRRLDERCHL